MTSPRHRDTLGGERVEGVRAVTELIRAARRAVREVWLAGDSHGEERDALAALAHSAGIPVRRKSVQAVAAAAVTEVHQGVLAWADPIEPVALDDLCPVSASGSMVPFLVVIDGVTDPRNLGALVRSAVCAGATGMVLPRHRSALITPSVTKAAAGAVEYLPMALVAGVPSALSALSQMGVWTVGLDAAAGQSVFGTALFDEPVALVLGSEGRGLSPLSSKRCDVTVSIPHRGPIESLNVAAAGAVAFFEVARMRQVSAV